MVIITDLSSHPCKYHVFLSFRGEDTRNNFTGHLCDALRGKGILTFMDDQLERGEDITTALIQAIRDSRISIVVFSENYASSKWCLEELVNIVGCSESNQQIIVPVFYKVDPSHVRDQSGSFGEGLAKHEEKFSDKIPEWRRALAKVANLSGFHLVDKSCSESKKIGEIIVDISKKVDIHTKLDVAEYPVGIETRVKEVQERLLLEVRDVLTVGIWGIGGIGKTTIAKAVYNSIVHTFDGACFLENIRGTSENIGGIVKLQKILLRKILKDRELKVTSVAEGITMIKEKLQGKRVLLVLDDVSDEMQLANIACRSWFGLGSRIIITTRDKKVLKCREVPTNLIYEVQELDYDEALELFCMKAFKMSRPWDKYTERTKRVVRYGHGHPLALIVLGSYLKGVDKDCWEDVLSCHKSDQIKDVLKISLEGLNQSQREAFLDIACFLKGESTEHASQILEACDINKNVINDLIEKALIRINQYGYIWMHDLLEEVGKDIVHQQSEDDPGERSRLWYHEDVYRVLTENTGTNKVRGIMVKLTNNLDVICLSAITFSNMKNLKLFIHRAGCYSGVVDNLPNSLRVIDWPDCPLQFCPSDNIPRELCIFHMPGSRITVLGDGFKRLKNLTSIEMPGCMYLTKVSDLSGIPNLQVLTLHGCENLVELHPSVGFLENLNYMDLGGCSRLEKFPTEVSWKSMRELQMYNCSRLENFVNTAKKVKSIKRLNLQTSGIKKLHSWIGCCTSLEFLDLSATLIEQLPSTIKNLTSLKELELSGVPLKELPSEIGCLTSLLILNGDYSSIEVLPLSIGGLTSLRGLYLTSTPIKELPSSIGYLTSLKELHLSQTHIKELPSSIGDLCSLEKLNLSQTHIKELPSSIGDLYSLEQLDLSHTHIKELPSSIGDLCSLEKLNLSQTLIKELPSYIGNFTDLHSLDASKTLIEELPLSIGNLKGLIWLKLRGCVNLRNVPHSVCGGLQLLEYLDLSKCPKLVTFPSRASDAESSSSGTLESMLPIGLISRPASPFLFPQLLRLNFEECYLSSPSEFLNNLDCQSTLEKLDLSRSSLDSLPACMGQFLVLEDLNLSNCKRLRDISQLPPQLEELYLNGCVLLERFSKWSDILEQRNTPGRLSCINLSNCNILIDNLGTDLLLKLAKSLPYQLAQTSKYKHMLSWRVSSNIPDIVVPKWFSSAEVDASVRKIDDDISEILINIPGKAEETGLVLFLVFESTIEIEDYLLTVVFDEKESDLLVDYSLFANKDTGSSIDLYVEVLLVCISFEELKVMDHVVRVKGDNVDMKNLKSFGCQLVNMPKIDGEDSDACSSDGEDSDACRSDGEVADEAATSLVSDDIFTGEGRDDHYEGELHRPTKRSRLI